MSQEKLTKDHLLKAPNYTVFKDYRGKTACADTPWWSPFEGAQPSLRVLEKAEQRFGKELYAQDGHTLFHIERDDELAEEHCKQTQTRFDDFDAALCALEYGYKLVKLPDRQGSPYFRMYVLGNFPKP